jgi:hypothetical protein
MSSTLKWVIWTKLWDEKECKPCEDLEGEHNSAPPPPHPNCKCKVKRAKGSAKLIREQVERRIAGRRFKFLGIVQETVDLTVGREHSFGGEFGVTIRETFGGSVSASETRTSARTLRWDPKIGGRSQDVYDVYDVIEIVQTKTWQRANGTTFEESAIVDSDDDFVITINVEHGDPVGFGGAGESEEDSSDEGDGEIDPDGETLGDGDSWGEEDE